jgi:hypothetical protein
MPSTWFACLIPCLFRLERAMNPRYLLAAAAALSLCGCHHVTTNVSSIDPSLRLAKTCPAAIKLFTSADRVEQPYREVALLNSSGETSYSNESDLIKSMRDKAATVGANGIILGRIDEPSALVKLAGQVAQIGADAAGYIGDVSAERKGMAMAIYIPADSIRTIAACANAKR